MSGLTQSVYVAKRDEVLRLCHLIEGSKARCVQTHHFDVDTGRLLLHLSLEIRKIIRLQCQDQDVSLALQRDLELFPLLRLGGLTGPTPEKMTRGFRGVVSAVKQGN